MYNEYFGLKETPFSIAPDPRYLYMSNQHREALAHLLYGVRSDGGFVLLTGEVGTGKTTVCRCLLEQMPENCDVAFILNPKLTVRELLSTICDELRINYPQGTRSIKIFIDLINAYLLDAHARGRKAVLIIDEAQHLGRDVLEQIRLLTNLETNQQKLLQIILLGQPEFLEFLSQPKLRQLSQRIVARYHLGALTKQEVGSYVIHRLLVAGLKGQLFPESTISDLYHLSRGIPRLINVLCDRALLGTYAQGRHTVNRKTLARAASEVFGQSAHKARTAETAHEWLLAGMVCIAAFFLLLATHYNQAESPVAANTFTVSEKETLASTEYRKPIPAENKSPAEDARVSKPSYGEMIPWSHIEYARLANLQPAPLNHAARETPVTPKIEDQASVVESGPNPTVATPFLNFTDEARSQSSILANLALLKLWGVDYESDGNESACLQAEAKGLRCLSGKGDLDELRGLNVPAVLKLTDPQGRPFHVTLKSLGEQTAGLALGDETATVGVDEIASLWKGEYTLLWRPPPRFGGNLREGDRGPAVKWLESRLRRLEGTAVTVRKDPVFDDALVELVKKYQLSKGLKVDGVVGPKTVIHLNTDTSTKIPLLTNKNKDN